jgi:hypothetical protein
MGYHNCVSVLLSKRARSHRSPSSRQSSHHRGVLILPPPPPPESSPDGQSVAGIGGSSGRGRPSLAPGKEEGHFGPAIGERRPSVPSHQEVCLCAAGVPSGQEVPICVAFAAGFGHLMLRPCQEMRPRAAAHGGCRRFGSDVPTDQEPRSWATILVQVSAFVPSKKRVQSMPPWHDAAGSFPVGLATTNHRIHATTLAQLSIKLAVSATSLSSCVSSL